MLILCSTCAKNNFTCPLKDMTDTLEQPLQGKMIVCREYTEVVENES